MYGLLHVSRTLEYSDMLSIDSY